MPRHIGSRTLSAALAGSLLLAGCGGGGGPSIPGQEYKTKAPEAMKPCDEANKATPKALSSFKSGKMSVTEAMEVANAGVAACEASLAAWQAMTMPKPVAKACLPEAQAKLDLAHAQVSALNHQMAKPYKTRIERVTDQIAREVKACKDAMAK